MPDEGDPRDRARAGPGHGQPRGHAGHRLRRRRSCAPATPSTTSPRATPRRRRAAARCWSRRSSTRCARTSAPCCGRWRSAQSERAERPPAGSARTCTVAFADLTGFTRLGESVRRVRARRAGGALRGAGGRHRGARRCGCQDRRRRGDARVPRHRRALSMLLDLNDAADAEDSGLPAIHAGVAAGPALEPRRRRVRRGREPGQPDRPVRPRPAAWWRRSEVQGRRARASTRGRSPAGAALKGLAERRRSFRRAAPRAGGARTPRLAGPTRGVDARSPRPAAWRSASALSVFSQVKSWSSRPKWP